MDIYLKPEEIDDVISIVYKRWVDPPMPGNSQYEEFRREIQEEISQKSADNTARVIINELDPYIKQVVDCDKFKDGDALIDPVGLAALNYYWQELKKLANK